MSELIKAGIDVAKALLPPANPNDEAAQTRWRWTIFSSIVAIALALTAHILLACGLVPMIYPGFALASDTKQMQHQIAVIESISISNEILEEASKVCQTNDPRARLELNQYIVKLQREYYEITSQTVQVPGCDQL